MMFIVCKDIKINTIKLTALDHIIYKLSMIYSNMKNK